MKRTILLLALAVFSIIAFAQTKTEVKFERTDGKYHIIIDKEVDGKITTIDKIYNSMEDMKNDPELKDIDMHFFNNDHNEFTFSHSDKEEDHDVDMMVEIMAESDMEVSENGTHNFVFSTSASNDSALHEIKVIVDDGGKTQIFKNGEVIDGGSWNEEEGTGHHFSSGALKDGNHKKVMIYKSTDVEEDSEGNNYKMITVKVVEKISLHLEELTENEFISIPKINAKGLNLDNFNYYPNPNNGRFTLKFKADKRPIEIKILTIDGKEVFAENINNFTGTYQNEFDLSSQKKGIYLLQIIQGNKATNKKIVIE